MKNQSLIKISDRALAEPKIVSRLNRLKVGFAMLLSLSLTGISFAKPYPDPMPVIDVTESPYFADNTGSLDATAAIQNAMTDALDATRTGDTLVHIVYFPNGTYRVTDKMSLGSIGDNSKVILEGQSQSGVILKLDDNSPGFQSQAGSNAGFQSDLKPVLSFFEGGSNNDSFWNSVADMTIDIGTGNPGAIGLEFHNNNVGSIRNVTIRSSDPSGQGAIGLKVHRGLAGIGLFKDLTVDGFEYGFWFHQWKIGYVLENIEIKNQRTAGIYNNNKLITIRNLTSFNQVPAVINNGGAGLMILLDATLDNGMAGAAAIENQGYLYARNIETSGYSIAIDDSGTAVTSPVVEHISHPVITAFEDTPKTASGLNIEDTPTIPWPDETDYTLITEDTIVPLSQPTAWAIVDSNAQDVDTVAIQKAIDSGAENILLPTGVYKINDQLYLRGAVKRIHFGYSEVDFTNNFQKKGFPVLTILPGDAPVVLIEAWAPAWVGGSDYDWIRNESTKTVVLKDLFLGWGTHNYTNMPGAGDLYIENVASGGAGSTIRAASWEFTEQTVYARQLNPERNQPHIVNDGGQLWLLGSKVGEKHGPYLVTTDGGTTEALGIFFNSLTDSELTTGEERALIINEESEVTVVGYEDTYRDNPEHTHTIVETQSGVTEKLAHSTAPKRAPNKRGAVFPLYRGGGTAGVASGGNSGGVEESISFRNGDDGYAGTIDTYIRSGFYSGSTYSNWTEIEMATNSIRFGLLRFDGLIGNGTNQIPLGSQIISATLTLATSSGGGEVATYRVLEPWGINSTWDNAFGGDGVDLNDTDASGVPDGSAFLGGALVFDVTATVTEWVNGSANLGWVLVKEGNVGRVHASDNANGSMRPKLEISFVANPSETTLMLQQDLGGYTGVDDTFIREGFYSNDAFGSDPVIEVATNSTRHGLIRFRDIFGTGLGMISPDVTVTEAKLILTGTQGGGSLEIFRLFKGWDENTTWNSDFGGNGVQADGNDASSIVTASGQLTSSEPLVLDVTDDLISWQNGANNYGWLILKSGNNAAVASSEYNDGSMRPLLEIKIEFN